MSIPVKITVEEALEKHGIESIEDCAWLAQVPACCSWGCETDPDGDCAHGYPSIYLESGLI